MRERSQSRSAAPRGRPVIHNLRRWRRVAMIAGAAAVALVATTVVALQASAADDVEHIPGGGFDTGTGAWYAYPGSPPTVVDGQLCANVPGGSVNRYDAGIGLNGLKLRDGGAYTL